jgi:hypothetical protein
MLDTMPTAPALAPIATRWRVERDEYGPLGACAGGLFITPVAPRELLSERDELGRRVGAWVPDRFLL